MVRNSDVSFSEQKTGRRVGDDAANSAMLKRFARFALRHVAFWLAKSRLFRAAAPWPGRIGRWLGLQPPPPRGALALTREWAAARAQDGRSYAEVGPGVTLRRPAPFCFGGDLDWRIRIQTEPCLNPPLFLATLPHARVVGPNGTVITSDNLLLGDLSQDWFFKPEQHPLFYRFKLPPVKKLSGKIVNLARLSGWNYAHWVVETLPRWDLLRQAGIDWREADGFIFNGPGVGFQSESLDLLGVPTEKRIFLNSQSHIECEQLIAPSLSGISGQPTPWVVEYLRNKVAAGAKKPGSPARLYISRSKAKFRNVVNEAEVRGVLAQHGFTAIYCEELAFREQVSLFAGAEAVVAPHGAGLSNLVFCPRGTKVIEFFSPRYVNAYFWAVCHAGDLPYVCVLGTGPRPAVGKDPHDGENNMQVNVTELDRALKHFRL